MLLWSYKLSYQIILEVSLVLQGRSGVIRFMICVNYLHEVCFNIFGPIINIYDIFPCGRQDRCIQVFCVET